MIETAEFLRPLPKVQLHCHLEGTLRASTFVDLARRHRVALTYTPGDRGALPSTAIPLDEDPEAVYRFETFQQFLMTFAAVSRSLAEPEDYGRLAREYIEDALVQNVQRAEVFISPSVWQFFHKELDVRECIRAMRDAFDAAKDRVEVELIADVTRNFGIESAMQTVRTCAALQDLGIIGIGLGGDEARFPAELFKDVFAYARSEGFHVVAHAGEAAGAQSVRAAVEVLGAERIGHGIRALEDHAVIELLAERAIPLEVCPTSNALTGVAPKDQAHPFVDLDAAGCIVTIDADDPALFRTTLSDELAFVAGTAGRDAVVRFAHNAISGSFADARKKVELRAALDAAVGLEPDGPRRTS